MTSFIVVHLTEATLAQADPVEASEALVHIVDDDEAVRDALAVLLRIRRFQVRQYDSPLQFLDALHAAEPGCIVTDVQMPEMTGLELLKRLREAGVAWPVILISGRATFNGSAEAIALGAAAVVEKPFDPDAMVETVRRLTSGGPADDS